MRVIDVPKSKFKSEMHKYLRQVENESVEICITDHGKRVVKVIPYTQEDDQLLCELRGLVERFDSPFEPVANTDWEALK